MEEINILLRRFVDGSASSNRILAYAKGFAEQGHQVNLYYLITDKSRNKPLFNNPNIKVICLWETNSYLIKRSRLLSYLINLFRFRAKVNKGSKLFIYGSETPILLTALSLNRKVNVFNEITEHPFNYGKTIKSNIASKISLYCIKKFEGLFVISNSLRKYYIENGIEESKINIINMFVDISRFTGLVKNTKDKYIAYCGTISDHKDGVGDLIKAFALFHNTYSDYKLFIIGKTVKESLSTFTELAESCKIKKQVVFTGFVSAEEMPQLLMNADLLALARPQNVQTMNGFPTKLGEYLSTGNPVVVTNIGEISNFIKDSVNGFLVEPSSVKSFATKLIYVIENEQHAKNAGEKGRQLALTEFSYKSQTKKALSIMFP